MKISKTTFLLKLLTLCVACAVTSGCANKLSSALGLDKRGPDEFTITSYPAPNVPDDCTCLPAPVKKD